MKRTRTLTQFAVAACVLWTMSSYRLWADDQNGFTFNFEVMRRAHLSGNDVNYADVYNYYDKVQFFNRPFLLDSTTALSPSIVERYGTTFQPHYTGMTRDVAYSGQLVYRKRGRGVGAHVTFFSTGGSDQGRVTSPASDDDNTFINGVRMFGRSFVPVTNELEGIGDFPLAPVSFNGRNNVTLWTG